MKRNFALKVFITTVIMVITISTFVLAASGLAPKFSASKFKMKLGSTQSIAGIINIDREQYPNLRSSSPSVVAIQSNGTLKAMSTGISTLTYTFSNTSGDTMDIWCYIEVSQNDSTYSEINGTTASKIKVTLELGEYSTVIESPNAAIPELPDVKKAGYILEGWYKDSKYITKLGERERLNKDTTLYAKWITKEEASISNVVHSSLYNDIDFHWARNYIESVSYMGLFNGVSEKMFGPDKTMTRAMVITVLGRLDEIKILGRTTDFKDVPAGAYYEEYVAWGLENKIVSGTSAEEFSPNKEITREEMAVMMANYIKYKNYKYELESIDFSDKDLISSWAIESVKILNNLGIMKGNEDNTYNPKKVATRAEIATVFYNYLNYINK